MSLTACLVLFNAGDPAIGCNNSTEFDCGGDGKMCIPLEKVCNRQNDCGGWQDEPKGLCHVNECTGDNLDEVSQKRLKKEMNQQNSKGHITVVGGGCDQQCIDLPIGFKCACDNGYTVVNNTTCVGKFESFIQIIEKSGAKIICNRIKYQ